MFVLRLFRGAQIENEAGVITGAAAQRHRLALLALLTIALPRGLTREKLIGYLWPDGDSDHARNLLNQAVHTVRQALGAEALLSIGDELRLNAAVVGSDVAAFEEALATGDLEGAVDRHEGPFLDGFFLERSAEFERWLVETRERLEREYAKALQGLAKAAESAGDFGAAAEWWRRMLAVDPYCERVVLGLMLALEAAGDRAEAIRQADMHAALLSEELDAEPDPEVKALAKRMRVEPAVASAPGMDLDGATRQELGHQARESASLTVPTTTFLRRGITRLDGRYLAVGAAAIAGVVLLYSFRTVDNSVRLAPVADPITTAPAVAVLPFNVHGEGLEVWRGGMVDLLSTGLDGAGGLRAIDSRTVFARWEEEVGDGVAADLDAALRVARRTEARYALVGSAVLAEREMRLVADIYDLDDGHVLGQAQVEGSPDSVLVLVDRLGMQALELLLGRERQDLLPIELASLTTSSLPALKAYLEGEERFRHADFGGAIEAWERAVAADTLFALAYFRQSEAHGWQARSDRAGELAERARRLAGRLPPREALLIRDRFTTTATKVPVLEEAVHRYPDDAEIWYQLGEAYYHLPGALKGPDEAERAFRRAVELQPRMAPYRIHLLDLAFEWRDDRASAARELDAYARLAPAEPRTRAAPIAFAFAFGTAADRARALAALDTLDPYTGYLVANFLGHPRLAGERDMVISRIEDRLDDSGRQIVRDWRYSGALERGMVRTALGDLGDPVVRSIDRVLWPMELLARGLAVPGETADAALALDPAAATPGELPGLVLSLGVLAAERGRKEKLAQVVEFARRGRNRLRAEGDSVTARGVEDALLAVDAYSAWKLGRRQQALDGFRSFVSAAALFEAPVWFFGRLALELNRLEEAEQAFRALWRDPLAHLYLGRIYERTGRPAEAQKAYEFFASAWQDADPELQPMVREARQAVTRLAGRAVSPVSLPDGERLDSSRFPSSTSSGVELRWVRRDRAH